jgi:phage N-6-adenine-methyltransferase
VFSSASAEWYTPAKYIEAARAVLGGFDLDPASNPKANEVVRASQFFTAADDGLSKEWRGRVWLNPPYGDDGRVNTGTWCAKLIAEHRAGRVDEAVLLVNAVTDRKWFQQLWDFALCFTGHRIEFYTPNGTPQSPISGNVFAYLGEARRCFAQHFEPFGAVVERVHA